MYIPCYLLFDIQVVFDFKICKHELEIFLALFWFFFVVEKNYIICLVVKAMQCLFT